MVIQKTAPRKGPAVTIRFRSKAEVAQAKRAAKIKGQSLNTFVVFQTCSAANAVLDGAVPRSEQTV